MKWSKSSWAVMVQVVLTGKAQKVCSGLSLEDSSDYEVVKETVMNA